MRARPDEFGEWHRNGLDPRGKGRLRQLELPRRGRDAEARRRERDFGERSFPPHGGTRFECVLEGNDVGETHFRLRENSNFFSYRHDLELVQDGVVPAAFRGDVAAEMGDRVGFVDVRGNDVGNGENDAGRSGVIGRDSAHDFFIHLHIGRTHKLVILESQ